MKNSKQGAIALNQIPSANINNRGHSNSYNANNHP